MRLSAFVLCVSIMLGMLGCGEQQRSVPVVKAASQAILNSEAPESQENSKQELEKNTHSKVKKQVNINIQPVDINTANAEELIKALKGTGVGAAKVANIIEYRSQHGGFKSIEELNEVKGIGEKTLEKMRERVKISDVNIPTSKDTTSKNEKLSP